MVSWKEMVTNVSRTGLIISFGVHCTNRTDPRFEEKKKKQKKSTFVCKIQCTQTQKYMYILVYRYGVTNTAMNDADEQFLYTELANRHAFYSPHIVCTVFILNIHTCTYGVCIFHATCLSKVSWGEKKKFWTHCIVLSISNAFYDLSFPPL